MSQAPVVAPTPTVIDRLRNVPSPVLVAASSFGLLMAVAGRYGWHRDELYFFEAGRHLAWGYVDFPPAVAAIGRVAECRQRRRRKPRVGMHRSATSLGSTVARPQKTSGPNGGRVRSSPPVVLAGPRRVRIARMRVIGAWTG
jgi:hypothetical protein